MKLTRGVEISKLELQRRLVGPGGGALRGQLKARLLVDDRSLADGLRQLGMAGDRFDGLEQIELRHPGAGGWDSAKAEWKGKVDDGRDLFEITVGMRDLYRPESVEREGVAFMVHTNVGEPVGLQEFGENLRPLAYSTDINGIQMPDRRGHRDGERVGNWTWFDQYGKWYLT